ncbi:MAG: hypothetical protein GY850_07025, partial [bacterium]|nr:hypothetical protein [bacterium]
VMAWPDDNHEFPVLWCNLTVVPEVMNVPIFDFIPLTDIVLRPDYAGTYISGVNDLKKKAFDVFGETLLDKDAELPSLTIYALSPYRFVGMVSDAGVELVPRVAEEYIAAYADLSANAQPLTDNSNRAYCKTKKTAARILMKGNDPGYPFMLDVFGEELTHKVFDIVF